MGTSEAFSKLFRLPEQLQPTNQQRWHQWRLYTQPPVEVNRLDAENTKLQSQDEATSCCVDLEGELDEEVTTLEERIKALES